MWKFTLRVTMYIKKLSASCTRKFNSSRYTSSTNARGSEACHMVTYNICETIFEIKLFTQSINE